LAVDVLAEVLRANPRLHPRAPKLVIDLIAQSAGDDFWTACDRESAAMAEVYTSPVGQSLVHAFLLQDRAKKSPGLAAAPQPAPRLERIGIVGLGVMGKSIAQLMVHSPWSFVLYDQDPAVRQEVAGQIPGDRYTVVESWEGLRTCDAVIENVYEQLDCKRNVLRCLEQVVAPQTCLLSNTSVIPLADLAVELQHPERFCGLHFFNPIRETQLAEIATHPKSAATAVWIAAQLAKQLKKMVIVVGDGPGLVVNRLLMAVLNEAQRLLAVGYSIEQIDRAAADFGWRLGPFRIMDVIGLKTTLDAGTQIAKHLPGAVTAPPFLIPLIKAGRWGQQQGRGFYRYAADSEPWVDDEVMPLLDAYLRSSPNAAVGQSAALAHRLVAAMLVQAVAILERGQVRDAAEIDLCCLLALGFPPHKGGPLYWADHYPLGRLLEEILDPELAAGLRVACPAGHRFYPPPAAVGSTRAGEPSRTSS
jgi:3-hydroxyacyl-CoA dehydrogenase